MEHPLTIEALRRELGLNQAEFAQRLGLANKASVSLLERGGPCSLPVALRLEELSAGRIDAAALNGDVAAAREAVSRGAAQCWELSQAELHALEVNNPAGEEPARVILCDVCEERLDLGAGKSCAFVDCPHAQRAAA